MQELRMALVRDAECDIEAGEHFLCVGNTGKGINSWSMYYFLSYKPLYITWARPYGGMRLQNSIFILYFARK